VAIQGAENLSNDFHGSREKLYLRVALLLKATKMLKSNVNLETLWRTQNIL